MKNIFIKIVAGFFYIAMVLVNFLANALPINNRTTGAISNAYSNLFAPAGLTFSIWGLIYLLLGGYIFYQFTKGGKKKEKLLKKINPFFITTSIANIAWIFSWHYDYIGLSLFLMLILLISLIKIADILRREKLKFKEKLFISVPFSVYFGWITVATIANITVFLVSLGWNGFGMADFIWTSIILLIGALIGILRMCRDKNIAYGLVLVWAYFGILFKHLSSGGFSGQYPSVILIAVVCLVLFGFFTGRISCKK
ncbi:MAG: tryptophan-rich sensory protein [Bacteroidales bacterium]